MIRPRLLITPKAFPPPSSRKNHYLIIVVIGLLIATSWELGTGLYIYAKAQAGQWFISRAWETTLQTHHPVKPWSWADTTPVGRLVVKDLDIDQYVLAGSSGRTMAWGPGHYAGTVYPGEPGNAIIAGHRDTHFRFLKDLHVGHAITFQDRTGTWQQYVVDQLVVIDVTDDSLMLEGDEPGLVLLTCYPFDAIDTGGPQRYVVYATKQDTKPQA